MAALELTHIAKSYGAVRVIEDLSLAIENGEFVVLVGPSGCGKSTLLRMIAGLESISGGDLLVDGKRTNDVSPRRRDMSMVFQSYALFPHMDVRNNTSFGPRVRGEPKDETETRIGKASRILNLEDTLERRPGQLSGGQRQRVAMGRSIVRDPKVLLFDEPLSNLDAKLRVQMRTEIKALHQTLETTIVYVTHDQIEAMTMADWIVVMNHGHIEHVGTPLELYDRPANRFVAGFIGSPTMSFLDGRYRLGGDAPGVELSDGSLLPVADCRMRDSDRVVVGIRPETYVRDEQGPLALGAEVVEPTGPEIHVFGSLSGTPVRCVFRDRLLPEPGDTIRLSVPTEHVHLFDAVDGGRLGA